jgi:DNA gyrase subunit A
MVTKKGIVKKTELAAFSNPRSAGIIAMSIDEGDDLIDVQLTLGNQELFMGTRKGMAIRFKEEDVRDMGRMARGVIGIRMDDDDVVVGVEIPTEGNSVVTVSEKGFGKRTSVAEYRLQSRGGRGIINLKTVPRVGMVSGILQVTGDEDLMLISDTGNIIRVKVEAVPLIHRSTQGVKLIDLAPEERLVGMARAEREEEKEGDDQDLLEDIPEEMTGDETDDTI